MSVPDDILGTYRILHLLEFLRQLPRNLQVEHLDLLNYIHLHHATLVGK